MPTTQELLGGGGGAPTAKFPATGTSVTGVIKSKPKVSQQTDINGVEQFWPDQQPKMQIEVTVLTDERDPAIEDDDGSRRLFVKGYMMNAVSDAVTAAGVDDLHVGGTLTVTFVDTKPAKQRGHSPAKLYEAKYSPPSVLPTSTSQPQFDNDEEPF